jgi:hypothetical protein
MKEAEKHQQNAIGGRRGGMEQQQEGMLGEDLHSIDFSQLVSTVITTEDYLPRFGQHCHHWHLLIGIGNGNGG